MFVCSCAFVLGLLTRVIARPRVCFRNCIGLHCVCDAGLLPCVRVCSCCWTLVCDLCNFGVCLFVFLDRRCGRTRKRARPRMRRGRRCPSGSPAPTPARVRNVTEWRRDCTLASGVCVRGSGVAVMVCPCNPIVPSPVTVGYRNKCLFSIGYDESGEVRVRSPA